MPETLSRRDAGQTGVARRAWPQIGRLSFPSESRRAGLDSHRCADGMIVSSDLIDCLVLKSRQSALLQLDLAPVAASDSRGCPARLCLAFGASRQGGPP